VEPSNRRAETLSVLAAQHDAVPPVRTMTAKAETEPRTIELPGSLAAFDSATLSARATGYISVRNADIGSKVHKGDVLAVIAAPDLDQQLAQAKAQLLQLQAAVGQAEANAELGRVTDARTARLVAQGWSSRQQGDQDRLGFAASRAALAVAGPTSVARSRRQAGAARVVRAGDRAIRRRNHQPPSRGRQSCHRGCRQWNAVVFDRKDRCAARADLCAAKRLLRHSGRRSRDDHHPGAAPSCLRRHCGNAETLSVAPARCSPKSMSTTRTPH
jgi:hypothetical protein